MIPDYDFCENCEADVTECLECAFNPYYDFCENCGNCEADVTECLECAFNPFNSEVYDE